MSATPRRIELPPDTLKTLFAVPVATFRLQGLEALNRELASLVLARENDDTRNRYPSQQIQNEVFESGWDLFKWDDPPIRRLRELVVTNLGRVVAWANGYGPKEVAELKLYNDAWFHITRRGGYVQPHNHPNASWSVVYFVQDGRKDEGHEDSGALIFHSPRAGSAMHRDPGNVNLPNTYTYHAVRFQLEPGDLVIFPSDLLHSVSPFFGDGERITIAANYWFARPPPPA